MHTRIHPVPLSTTLLAALATCASLTATPARAAEGPYHILATSQTMGTGGIDYVTADSDERRVYVPRGSQVLVFDLDSLEQVGAITNTSAHGVAIDAATHHAFSSSSPVAMWDTRTLAPIKTIAVQGRPDGIFDEPLTGRIYVLSHSAPNVTVLDAKDGTEVGTIDLGGAPEQAAGDGAGNVYVDIEDKDQVAVVDAKTLKVTAHYDLGGKGRTPAGLALDAKNHVLFVLCREPAVAVMLDARDGKCLGTVPIGQGTDGGTFNPATLEAFSSQRNGTLSVIKETSPTAFELAQTVQTKQGAKTCTFDAKTGHVVLIATEAAPATAGQPAPAENEPRKGRGRGGPALLDLIVVGK